MNGRAIAKAGQKVQFPGTGGQSSLDFHSRPDGAGVFAATAGGGFYYSSNSETKDDGGVGVIEFDANGDPIDYYRTLSGTRDNCGGGYTPWNTWISCEEDGSIGRVWQTDPTGLIPSRRTEVVATGGNYESFAYDDREELTKPRFFTTEDSTSGPLVRFTPNAMGMECYNQPTAEEKWCTLENGDHDYLRIDDGASGTFSWVANKTQATPELYPKAEGIDVVDGVLFFVSKLDKTLFELDLDAGTFTRTSTVSGAFDLQPDQLKAINNDPSPDSVENNIIYFCEDGGANSDIHGRNTLSGEYFTIVRGDDYATETTGLAFSPDLKYMFIAFQGPGVIWQFWRDDGLPFNGQIVDIKYHSEIQRRRLSEQPLLRARPRHHY